MATKLPKQLYRRGKQGTLVYSPDIAVFVKLSNDEILDLSPYIVDFNVGRVVNDISSFSCSIDNKFGQFDRVIKRMDRITVFLKRISWLQVFSGYVTTVPWQTVVPGNVIINAQCTMKRLAHNYFDANSTEGMALLPFRNEQSFQEADGGAASTIVRLLTKIALWPEENINIQMIPAEWANDAAKVIDGLLKENDVDMTGSSFQDEIRQIKDSLLSLIDSLGWTGAVDGPIFNSLSETWSNASVGTPTSYDEASWRSTMGSKPTSDYGNRAGASGAIPDQYLFTIKANGLSVLGNHKPGVGNYEKTFDIYLRLDAADSLADLVNAWIQSGKRDVTKLEGTINVPIKAAYLSYDEQKSYMFSSNGGCFNSTELSPEVLRVPSVEERFTGELYEKYKKVKKYYEDKNGKPLSLSMPEYTDIIKELQDSERIRLGLNYIEKQAGMGAVSRELSWNNRPVVWIDYPDYTYKLKKIITSPTGSNGTALTTYSSTEFEDIKTPAAGEIEGAIKLKCPPGSSIFGWATAIQIEPSNPFYTFAQSKLRDYGWEKLNDEGPEAVWNFVGNDNYPIYWDANSRIEIGNRKTAPEDYNSETYTGAYTNVLNQFSEKMSNDGVKALFNVLWMGSQSPETLSEFAVGERSWLNDSSLLEVIQNICPSSVRDFMSAPNGDFIAFVPDRIGKYSNFPAIQVRDIELIDFKAMASDNSLVTHYLSNADVEAAPMEGLDNVMQLFFTSAMLTVEQAPLMNFLLGRPIEETDKEYGPKILQTFGLRPKIEDNKFIRNRAYNFIFALHKFQEMWANQWQFVINLTFMPELYPGMRIELIDRTLPDGTPAPVAVYVESVSHSGSRSTGFTTTAVVSTPMIKINGIWSQYRPEFGPVDMPDTVEDVVQTQKYQAKLESLKNNKIINNIY